MNLLNEGKGRQQQLSSTSNQFGFHFPDFGKGAAGQRRHDALLVAPSPVLGSY
jgi:uncharacterized caspase-like protein